MFAAVVHTPPRFFYMLLNLTLTLPAAPAKYAATERSRNVTIASNEQTPSLGAVRTMPLHEDAERIALPVHAVLLP